MNIVSTSKYIRWIKKVLRQDHYLSTRLPYANKKIGEIWMSIVITTCNSTQDMNIKLQLLKGKSKLKFYKKMNNYYDEMKYRRQNGSFQFEEDSFSKDAQGISKIYHEVLLLMNFYRLNHKLRIWTLIIMIYITLLLKIEMIKKL